MTVKPDFGAELQDLGRLLSSVYLALRLGEKCSVVPQLGHQATGPDSRKTMMSGIRHCRHRQILSWARCHRLNTAITADPFGVPKRCFLCTNSAEIFP
jgi:hypothetical protein